MPFRKTLLLLWLAISLGGCGAGLDILLDNIPLVQREPDPPPDFRPDAALITPLNLQASSCLPAGGIEFSFLIAQHQILNPITTYRIYRLPPHLTKEQLIALGDEVALINSYPTTKLAVYAWNTSSVLEFHTTESTFAPSCSYSQGKITCLDSSQQVGPFSYRVRACKETSCSDFSNADIGNNQGFSALDAQNLLLCTSSSSPCNVPTPALPANLSGGTGSIVGASITEPGTGYDFSNPFSPTLIPIGSGTGGNIQITRGLTAVQVIHGGHNFLEVQITGGTGQAARASANVAGGQITSLNLLDMGYGYHHNDNLTVNITGGGGSGALANATLSCRLTHLQLIQPFLRYTITVSTGGCSSDCAQIRAHIQNAKVGWVEILNAGSGYSSQPTAITVLGGTTNAILQPVMTDGSISAVNILQAGDGYPSATAVLLTGGGGSGASAQWQSSDIVRSSQGDRITALRLTNSGNNYTSPPTVSFTHWGDVSAEAKLSCRVAALNVINPGNGYVAPSISFSGGGCTTLPSALLNIKNNRIESVSITHPGAGCTSTPTVTLTGGSGASVNLVMGPVAEVLTGGSDYSTPPLADFSVVSPGSGMQARLVTSFVNNPSKLAFTGNGNTASKRLLLYDAGQQAIKKLEPLQASSPQWHNMAAKNFSSIGGMVADGDLLWATDSNQHQLLLFNSRSSDHLIQSWSHFSTLTLNFPAGLALWQQHLFLVDRANHRVLRLLTHNLSATPTIIGSGGNEPYQLFLPNAVAVDSNYLYVLDLGNHKIKVFDHTGNFITSWGQRGNWTNSFESPEAIVVRQGYLYVADTGNSRVVKYEALTGCQIDQTTPGSIQIPRDLVFHHEGNELFVSDAGQRAIRRIHNP